MAHYLDRDPLVRCRIYNRRTELPEGALCRHIQDTGECRGRCYVLNVPVGGPYTCPSPYCRRHNSRHMPHCLGPDCVVTYAAWRAWRALMMDREEAGRVGGLFIDTVLADGRMVRGAPIGYRVVDDDDERYFEQHAVFNGYHKRRGDPRERPVEENITVTPWLEPGYGFPTSKYWAFGEEFMPEWRRRILEDLYEVDEDDEPPAPRPRRGGAAAGNAGRPGRGRGGGAAAGNAARGRDGAATTGNATRGRGGAAAGAAGRGRGRGGGVAAGAAARGRGGAAAGRGRGAGAAGPARGGAAATRGGPAGQAARARGGPPAAAEEGDENLPTYSERATQGERTVDAEEVDYQIDD